MSNHHQYLLSLSQAQMNHIRQISKYKNASYAGVIRDAIQKAIIRFETEEKPLLDQIRQSQQNGPCHDEFFNKTPWESSY